MDKGQKMRRRVGNTKDRQMERYGGKKLKKIEQELRR